MEELVMLLDIYEEEVLMKHYIGDKIEGKDEVYLISKKFGFIKWLVKNDKIKSSVDGGPSCIMRDDRDGTTFDLTESILMLLSISDNPISDLCSYLK